MLIAGYETKGYQPYDFRLVQGRRIASGREVMVEQNWARDRGYGVGDRVRVAGPTGRTELPIIGIFKLTSSLNVGGLGYAAMPLPAARRLFDQPKGWMQISIVADDRGDVGPLKKRVEHVRGSGARVQTPGEVSDQISDQLAGLNIVLYFFSGVALFVGGFLILNSFNMTVLQRMRELGMLRTLGASRRMAMSSVLIEALVLGIVGTVLGLALGLLLASGLISLMRGMGVPVGTLDVSAGAAITAAFIGIVVTLLGAFWPARRAGRISPIRAVLGDAQVRRTASKRRLVIGLALFLPGVWFGGSFWFGGESETGGLAAYGGILMTMAMFAGMAAAAPFIILPVIRWLAVPVRRLLPNRRPAGGGLAALQPAPHRRHRRRAHDRALGGRRQQLDVVELHRDHQRSDRQGVRARLHRPGTGLHDRAGRRAGRAALGPDGDRGDARDRHGRAAEGDAARPPRREERIEARPRDRGRPGEAAGS